ncbi:hypothetical membrane protein, conserved [Thermococcus onnurineus NA1]|uniref:Hypothetical membrane protein, conserved n=1 Tax=Thermococcus onnurineus (strain NA1) TaxID=523850 RepID=B6YWD4_THEON|nr:MULTISPECIES: hypothetical protein [Thermococcus]ACJ16397.1 hypothetical membrane protein, conserved [Thermococcus onnurineus NA1]NJE47554.1 hypothetical protein [Thermococcus sp. GR7]NJE79536.1 hypothetical protein [Thermococcus sp. GR4]NJF22490.1 hypothetical protein [Thermococcus sp. GR5]
MEITSGFILAIMALAAVSSIQFFKGRKLNLQIMQHYLRSIEDVVKPEDKDYVWLGGYIGFRAYYKVNRDNIRKFEYTLTLLPRQSILYFPIALLTSRHDKLYIVIKPESKIKREAHLIQKGYYRIKPKIEDEELLQKEIVEIAGTKYEALYEKRRDVELLKYLVENLSKPTNVKHISLTPKTNVFYVLMKPEPDTIEDDIKKIVEFAKEKLKEGPFSS